MRAGVVAGVLLLCACTSGQTTGPGANASTGARLTSATPLPSAPAVVAFTCRLPVTPWGSVQTPAGFITFPAGSFSADPTSGPTPGYYDIAAKAWLPVGRAAVAPDGRHYATTAEGVVDKTGAVLSPATLHIVDVSTRQDRVLALVGVQPAVGTTALFPEVADFELNVIYVVEHGQAGTGELYGVDTSNGMVTNLTGAPTPEAVEGGGVWYGDAPNAQGVGAPPGRLQRWDLRSHTSTVWFKRDTGEVIFLGLDRDGSAIVRWTTNNPEGSISAVQFWSVSSPGHERLLASESQGLGADREPMPAGTGGMIADAHGLWIGSRSGVFLLSRSGGMQKMSDYAGVPANGCL